MIEVYAATDVGIGRANNEDRFLVVDNDKFVVADGMGGHAAGEIASNIMVERAGELLKGKADCDEDYLSAVIKDANVAIIKAANSSSKYRGMGTTATIAALAKGKAIWANVGDSRAYLWRDGILRQLTRDHSLVADLVQDGIISKSEAKTHPKKNILTRAVGADINLRVDTGFVAVDEGDVLLLCTDGLTNVLEDEVIAELLSTKNCDLAGLLVKAALENGSRDNITAVVAVVHNH